VADESFLLKVITPGGVVCEERVRSVTLPSLRGEIGILPGHITYTGLLQLGVVEYVRAEDDSPQKMVVGGGLCAFSEEELVVLADLVDTPEGVNLETYDREREALRKIVEEGSAYEPAWVAAKQKLAHIEAVDQILK